MTSVPTVGLGELGQIGELLGRGGQARVYRVPEFGVPDVPGELVFKRYRAGQTPPHGLHRLVERRLRMDVRARRRLDGHAVWPVRVVEDHGSVQGVLMPLIGEDFFESRTLPSGAPARTLREVQHLFVDPARATRLGMPAPDDWHRLLLCRDFASAIHFLHSNGLVVGDLNAKNEIFRLTARPSVMIIDCDATRVKGEIAVVPQLNAPDWDPPERALSQATDLYKFGLFVLRCLGCGAQSSVSRDPCRADRVLDGEGRHLLRAALSGRPADRTTSQTWGRYFDRVLTGRHTVVPAVATRAPGAVTAISTGGWRRDPVTRKWIPANRSGG